LRRKDLCAHRVDPQGHPGLAPAPRDARERRRERVAVHQQGLHRVAHPGAVHLRVEGHGLGHGRVGRGVDVEVAHPRAVPHDGHPRVLVDELHQRGAPAGNGQVDQARRPQQLRHARPRRVPQKGHRGLGQARPAQPFAHRVGQRGVAARGLLAPAEHHGVARAQGERRGLDGHVGPGLVDHRDDPERHAAAVDPQPVGALGEEPLFREGIGRVAHLEHRAGHAVEARGREAQAVAHRLGEVGRGGEVGGVGGEDLVAPRGHLGGDGGEARGAVVGPGAGERALGEAGGDEGAAKVRVHGGEAV
jgi:hypothetical protein